MDWAAIGAIATGAAAIATAAAAWAAYRAVGAAFAIDSKQFERTIAARKRAMNLMAYALYQELDVLAMLMKRMAGLPVPTVCADEDAQQLFMSYYNGTEIIRIPLLERFADRLSEFDGTTAMRLVKSLTGALEMRALPKSHRIANYQQAATGINALKTQAGNLHLECTRAMESLKPFISELKATSVE